MTKLNKKFIYFHYQCSLSDPTPSASSLKFNFQFLDFDTKSQKNSKQNSFKPQLTTWSGLFEGRHSKVVFCRLQVVVFIFVPGSSNALALDLNFVWKFVRIGRVWIGYLLIKYLNETILWTCWMLIITITYYIESVIY